MDTKLKKSKQIRAFFYRAIALGLFLTTLLSITTGREAIKEIQAENYGILRGEMTGLTEFQKYIGKVYNDGMIAFAGVGDDQGYSLEDSGAYAIKEESTLSFYNAIAENEGDLFFYMVDNAYVPVEGEYGSNSHTNFDYPIFSDYDGHLMLPENMVLLFYQDGTAHLLNFHSQLNVDYTKFSYMPNAAKAQDIQFVLAMKDTEYISGNGPLLDMRITAINYQNDLYRIIISGSLFIIFLFLSMISIKPFSVLKKHYGNGSAKILAEIKLILLILAIVGLWKYVRHPFEMIENANYIKIFLWGATLYPLYLDFKLNGMSIFKNSIPAFCYNEIKEWTEENTWRRQLGVFSGVAGGGMLLCILIAAGLGFDLREQIIELVTSNSAAPVIFLGEAGGKLKAMIAFLAIGVILFACCIYFVTKFIQEVQEVTDKLSDIRNGKLNHPLKLKDNAFLKQTVEDVNDLKSGIEAAVEQKSQADKMRVELITNVSHDLKTPLTSIINYVDLLCEEELSPTAQDYVKALHEKSYKLKAMVQDVFEISKASSGNLVIEKVVLDLAKLIRQTLADMDERVASSSLTFKLNLPEQPVYIEGDGEKLYRIFQNLFVNAIQYSLDYSRVHVILTVENNIAVVSIKNTSRGELNFNVNEITERFVRADMSRTTEGSGLGLSIAKSFTEASGGEFAIDIDADMFTAIVRLPVVKKEEPKDNQEQVQKPKQNQEAKENQEQEQMMDNAREEKQEVSAEGRKKKPAFKIYKKQSTEEVSGMDEITDIF